MSYLHNLENVFKSLEKEKQKQKKINTLLQSLMKLLTFETKEEEEEEESQIEEFFYCEICQTFHLKKNQRILEEKKEVCYDMSCLLDIIKEAKELGNAITNINTHFKKKKQNYDFDTVIYKILPQVLLSGYKKFGKSFIDHLFTRDAVGSITQNDIPITTLPIIAHFCCMLVEK
jgi:YesN/AraC family two-component response regulator